MVHRERALAEHGGEHRRAHLFGQLDEIARRFEAVNLDTGDQHRLARLVEHRGGLVRRFLDLARVGLLEVQLAVPFDEFFRDFDLPIDHVAMNLDVAGPLLGPDVLDDAMQLVGGGAWIGQHGGRARHFVVNAALRFDLARLVMNQGAELALLLAGTAGKDQNRHALRKRSRDRIDHVMAAGAVGDADDADFAGRARVAVGRETDARLVRQRDDFHPVLAAQREKQLEREVAGDAKDMRHANLAQVRDQKIAQRHMPLHSASPSIDPVNCNKNVPAAGHLRRRVVIEYDAERAR